MNPVWFFALARHATFPSSNIVISSLMDLVVSFTPNDLITILSIWR